MPERIVSNMSSIGKWRDEIELALVFWLIGATIGIGQHLLSRDPFAWRVIIGRALSTGGLALVNMRRPRVSFCVQLHGLDCRFQLFGHLEISLNFPHVSLNDIHAIGSPIAIDRSLSASVRRREHSSYGTAQWS